MNTPPREIARFALYGDNAPIDNAGFVHIEPVGAPGRLEDWRVGAHAHRGLFQAVFLMDGHCRAQVDTMLWDCAGPTVVTMPPGVMHEFHFAADAKGHILTMDETVAGAVDLFAPLFWRPQALRLHENAPLRDRLDALLGQLAQEANAPRYGHALLADWLARSVLLLLVRLETERRISDEVGQAEFDLFGRYRALVEEHYRDAWQMTRYADALGVAVARLNRVCLKLANKSAFELAQDRLLLEACRRLAYFPEPIAAIGAGLGFGDPAYFSRLFRRRIGMTPKQYREQSRVGTEHGAGA